MCCTSLFIENLLDVIKNTRWRIKSFSIPLLVHLYKTSSSEYDKVPNKRWEMRKLWLSANGQPKAHLSTLSTNNRWTQGKELFNSLEQNLVSNHLPTTLFPNTFNFCSSTRVKILFHTDIKWWVKQCFLCISSVVSLLPFLRNKKKMDAFPEFTVPLISLWL
jgi:hypothetical protein